MGFFIGFLIFLGSYLILGPIIMIFYTTYNARIKTAANKVLLLGVGLAILYIAIWILIVCFATKYIIWCIVGSIIGLICAIVTFNKNKHQTLNEFNSNSSLMKHGTHRNIVEDEEADEIFDTLIEERFDQLEDIQKKINSVYAGNTEEFSLSELVGCAINLQSFKQNLSSQVYKLVEQKFKEYEEIKEKKKYNLMQFVSEMMRIQDSFSEIIGMSIYPDGTIK